MTSQTLSTELLNQGLQNEEDGACFVCVSPVFYKDWRPFLEPQSRRVRTLTDTSHLSFLFLVPHCEAHHVVSKPNFFLAICLWSPPYSAEVAVCPLDWTCFQHQTVLISRPSPPSIPKLAIIECYILAVSALLGAAQIFFLSNLNSGIFYRSG